MEESIAKKLALETGINLDQVVREYWEMLILKEISQDKLSDFLIFTGGTALRLCYQSPRFSNDLDFYLKRKLSFSLFKSSILRIKELLKIEIVDLTSKYYTFLAEFRIKEKFLPLSFRIKIEIRKKIIKKNYKLKLLTSPAVNFQVLFSVLDIEKIQEFKKKALVERKEPRDLFDLWYISQIKKEIFKKPKIKIDPKFLKQDLGKYLPEKFKPIIKQLQ